MSETKKPTDGDNGPAKMPGREPLRPALPKRFYKTVGVENDQSGFALVLDGKHVRTPNGSVFSLPGRAFAEAVAAEWSGQGENIDPATMPLTRIANTTIDGVAANYAAVAKDIQAFAGNDLVCYRAEAPEGLVERQRLAWDPVLLWAERTFGGRFNIVTGVVHIPQPPAVLESVLRMVEGENAFRLAALHILTTLSGSALLALAYAKGVITLDQAWAAALVDESWQAEHWGRDTEAEARGRHREKEFRAAARVLELS